MMGLTLPRDPPRRFTVPDYVGGKANPDTTARSTTMPTYEGGKANPDSAAELPTQETPDEETTPDTDAEAPAS
jgi:hypothetical protein